MVGSIGGFLGPYATGYLRDATHGFKAGLFAVAATAGVGVVLCLILPSRDAKTEARDAAA